MAEQLSTQPVPGYWQGEFERTGAWGMSTCVDMHGCDAARIRDPDEIRRFVVELCDLIKMKRFGECIVVDFGEDRRVAGYSMFQLIETSNISGHFANDSNAAYIDVFSCKAYEPADVAKFAAKFFRAGSTVMQVAMRK